MNDDDVLPAIILGMLWWGKFPPPVFKSQKLFEKLNAPVMHNNFVVSKNVLLTVIQLWCYC